MVGQPTDAENFWVINHIIDEQYRQSVLDILNGQQTVEMIFNRKEYQKKQTRDEKIVYAININAARNLGIEKCISRCDFVISLDQDCYFPSDEWEKVKNTIVEDQKMHNRHYYGVNSKRVHISKINRPLDEFPPDEAMPIFRNDAKFRFDPSLPFGRRTKVELLGRLGYEGFVATKYICKNVGSVVHIAFGDEEMEVDHRLRHFRRQDSLNVLLARLDGTRIKFL